MEEVIYTATSHNVAAAIIQLHQRGWKLIDKLVVGRHEVQLAKGHIEVIYDYHLIVQRPLPTPSTQEAAACL